MDKNHMLWLIYLPWYEFSWVTQVWKDFVNWSLMDLTIDRKVCEYTFWCCKQIPLDKNLICFNLHQFAVCYTVYCGSLLQDFYHYETIHIAENNQHKFFS